MMQQEEIDQLLQKYHKGTCTATEIAFLESWYAQWNKDIPITLTAEELHEDLLSIKEMTTTLQPKIKHKKLKQGFLVAASLFLILSTGLYFYIQIQIKKKSAYNLALHDVKPGSNKAIVTLANGQKLNLNSLKGGIVIEDSELTYNDGTPVIPAQKGTEQPEPLIVSTPKGGQYQITLSDGTRVWLNAASSLKFPSTFSRLKERLVELSGEAYFEVKYDAKQPFRVYTPTQIAEDLGTAFNINSYSDEPYTKTTLVEGSMQVQSSKDKQVRKPLVLKPSQQASLDAAGMINISQVNTNEAIGWKNENFIFDGEDLKSAMRKIARWYNVEVVYESDANSNLILEGLVSRKSNLSEVLKWIETVGNVHFKIKERRVIVTE